MRFLLHAQAIEAYDYRRRRKPGNNTLVQRISDVLDECKTVSKRIVGATPAEREAFIQAVKVARNYYTHYNPKLENKVARGAALLLLLVQLQAIIEMSLVRELGFRPTPSTRSLTGCAVSRRSSISKRSSPRKREAPPPR